mgnify:CR=1 FL=1
MRLDVWLFENAKYKSRNKASEAVKRGDITIDGVIIKKTSYEVSGAESIEINIKDERFVSNGGYKLQKAFKDFSIDVYGLECVDIGASTGGFTDCLLNRGAKRVYAVDVGESLLDDKLKNDERVVVKDNVNARNLTEAVLGGKVDFAVCDVSFISLIYVLKPIFDVLRDGGVAVTLIKPQFECGKKQLNKNGIVTDCKARMEAVRKICDYAESLGFTLSEITNAPIIDGKNIEYLLKLVKGGNESKVLDISNLK